MCGSVTMLHWCLSASAHSSRSTISQSKHLTSASFMHYNYRTHLHQRGFLLWGVPSRLVWFLQCRSLMWSILLRTFRVMIIARRSSSSSSIFGLEGRRYGGAPSYNLPPIGSVFSSRLWQGQGLIMQAQVSQQCSPSGQWNGQGLSTFILSA